MVKFDREAIHSALTLSLIYTAFNLYQDVQELKKENELFNRLIC